ncbi:MAG: protein translocase subunit SecF [Desulfurella sp.]|uniref:Protein-export membrane protein SecF n=1 Tax=Desulfurella multipotens TaxID=79269 RepID=A0A1G6IWV8_9BACT|nr:MULTISPECIES: protein translocase subunit SecF [Desulfurella]PMP69204.1 MAG: protein translocase subunit SecF [Desulfurella multipotens]PMP93430.1 MAG: protein translocase subunit SecF [Desulfurella sp.]SDC10891.1 preprotein translocase subunit SecF [Desulfurella multipotens]HEX14194.1 protein translocase subunit SecF [Desulfurella acetivorans]
MLHIFKPDLKIDFVSKFKWGIFFSLFLIFLGLASLIVKNGFKVGIEFKGGTALILQVKNNLGTGEVRSLLEKSNYFKHMTIENYGNTNGQYLIEIPISKVNNDILNAEIAKAFEKYGPGSYQILKVNVIGPKIGSDFAKKAIIAVVLSLLGILIYIAIRFKFNFAVASVVSLVHDVLITLGFLSLFNYELTLDVIAALLTIVGYSVNDTVIIFDRIREKLRNNPKLSKIDAINMGISETLSRTIITSGTVIVVTLILFLFGGSVLRGMSFALLVGFITGTYSSIFIAPPVLFLFKGPLLPEAKKQEVASEEMFKRSYKIE